MALTGANGGRSLRISIPMKTPSGNEMRRKYRDRFAYRRLRTVWERAIHYSIMGPERSWLEGMARARKKMRVTVCVDHKKLYDKDNLWAGCKVVFDSLKSLYLIHDDAPEFCEQIVEQEKINDCSTTITIADPDVTR